MSRPRIYDITPVVSPRIGVFPGDVGFSREVSLDFDLGHHLRLSSIRTTLHLGAHADGPNHYAKNGVSIAEREPSIYMGRCLVVRAQASRGERVRLEHLSEPWRSRLSGGEACEAPRVLVSTGSFPDPEKWNSDFCSFEPSLIDTLAKAGVRLIGIDTPSVDPEDSKQLESHQMIARHDLAVLEGLVLSQVPEGLYSLLALPLRIEGADAAPVRAILMEGPDRLETLS